MDAGVAPLRWVQREDDGRIFLLVPKCGSTSLRQAIVGPHTGKMRKGPLPNIEVKPNSVWYEPGTTAPMRYRVLNDIAFMMTPKCGSTSLCRGHLIGVCAGRPEENAAVAFVRDPLERLQSAFGTMWSENYISVDSTYTGFVDMVLEGSRNPHWEPQVNFFCQVPVLWLFPFERFTEVMWEQFGIQLPHMRKRKEGVPEIDPSYRQAELMEFYRADVDLWTEVSEKGTLLRRSQIDEQPRIITSA